MEIKPLIIDFTKDFVLETTRIRLIPIQREHLPFLLPVVLNEPELWKYTLDDLTSESKLKSYIEAAVQQRHNKQGYAFIVFDKETQEYVGSTRVYEIDLKNRNCAIGFTWYRRETQGTGINKHCKYLLFELAFELWQMERIQFRADKDNQRSINAIKSLGCQEEGILRSERYRPNGERRDSIILSLLKPEWHLFAKNQLQQKTTSR